MFCFNSVKTAKFKDSVLFQCKVNEKYDWTECVLDKSMFVLIVDRSFLRKRIEMVRMPYALCIRTHSRLGSIPSELLN